MPKTFAIAAELHDGTVVIHQMVQDDEPTASDIAKSLNRAGFGSCKRVGRADINNLPPREHRDAWVMTDDGRIAVDPSRIRSAPDAPKPQFDAREIRACLVEVAREIAKIKESNEVLRADIAEQRDKFDRLVDVVSRGVKQAELRQ